MEDKTKKRLGMDGNLDQRIRVIREVGKEANAIDPKDAIRAFYRNHGDPETAVRSLRAELAERAQVQLRDTTAEIER